MLHAIERVMPSFGTLGKKKQPCTPTAHLENAIEAKNKAIRDCESKLQTIRPRGSNLDDIYQAIKSTEDVIKCLKQLIESTEVKDKQSHLENRDFFSEIYAKLLILEAGAHTCYGFASQGALTSSPDLYSSLV